MDGRVIVVEQKRRYERAYTGQEFGNIPREAWVTFKLPEFGNQDIVWHENLKPHVLNVYEGNLYIVAMFPTGREFQQYGSPKPGYVPFKYVDGTWKRILFIDIPDAIYDTNMLTANAPPRVGSFVSFADKIEEMKNGKIPKSEKRLNPNWIID